MKKAFFFTAVFFLLVLTGCSSVSTMNTFAGNWILKFSGGLEDSYDLSINEKFEFSSTKTLTVQGQTMEITVKGQIGEDGSFIADFIYKGNPVGDLEGKMTFTEGTGTWKGGGLKGTWSAIRK